MRWSYKTVHFSLKKEGLLGSAFLDETEIEVSLNDYGQSGWELVSFMEVNDGLIAVFKQPFTLGLPSLKAGAHSDELGVSSQEPETAAVDKRVTKDSSSVSPLPPVTGEKDRDKKNTENDETDVGSIRIL
jgi:Domain of unknown function (DUF4177)